MTQHSVPVAGCCISRPQASEPRQTGFEEERKLEDKWKFSTTGAQESLQRGSVFGAPAPIPHLAGPVAWPGVAFSFANAGGPPGSPSQHLCLHPPHRPAAGPWLLLFLQPGLLFAPASTC